MYEEIKKRLNEYKKIVARKNEILLRIKELEQDVGISAMVQGEATSKTYKISSQTENQALELTTKKGDLSNLIDKYQLEIDRIDNALDSLYDKDKKAIELLYIEKRSMESVCYLMDRTRPVINKYAKRGLQEMQELFGIAN